LSTAQNFLSVHATELNLSLRKFLIITPLRQACFFGNSTQETQWFRYLKEGNGGNPTLHQGWYGRGFLQLTNPNGDINGGNNNYYKYFKFLGRSPVLPPGNQEITWRDEIGTDAHHAAHSACAYWVWDNKSAPDAAHPNRPQVDSANKYADTLDKNQRKTISTGSSGAKTWYYNQSFTNCATAVNFPGATGQNPPNMNGLVDRSVAFANALMVLTDTPVFGNIQQGYDLHPECYVQQRVP
jgi:hydroxyethylthiazole kinase